MMSDSDDTDVLLLIPPDLFLVPSSSESDASSDRMKTNYSSKRTGVISELVEHMQSLESRISAIESKDTSLDATFLNNSLDSQIENNSIAKFRQTLPNKTKLSVSENCSLQNTPVKPRQSLSVPSTPNGNSLPNRINFCQNDINLGNHLFVSTATNVTNANKHDENKHGTLISQSSVVVSSACNVGFPHVNVTSSGGKTYSHPVNCRNTDNIYVKPSVNQLRSMPSTSTLLSTTEQPQSRSKTNIPEMELSEVDELLQEMEATELELSKRINRVSMQHCLKEQNNVLTNDSNDSFKKGYSNIYKNSVNRRLEFKSQDSNECHDVLSVKSNKKSDIFADISLPYCDSFHINETDKMISEFKTWEQNIQTQVSKIGEVEHTDTNSSSIDKSIVKANDVQNKEIVTQQIPLSIDNVNNMNSMNVHNTEVRNMHKKIDASLHDESTQCNTATSIKNTECNVLHLAEPYKSLQQNGNLEHIKQTCDVPLVRNIAHASTNTDFLLRRTLTNPRLLSLSDFWENNGNKTQEEIHRIKLEEEKFRREHCEHLIQELQKRLLEQQEKVAVALRVDNEKNELIVQFHNAWSKLKQRVHILENEYSTLQTNFKNVTEKHQLEISEFQLQIKRCEGELSKALDLAAGYKEKNDIAMKEKVELLKNHADELENYKSFVQEAENRYEKLKIEYDKLLEKNQQSEEILKTLQQELGKERLKGGEVRNEMDVIHKALDTCEAELIVLRQEKENLQLKLREENGRNSILEQKNAALLSTLDDVKKAEKLARDETRFLAEQKEKIRCELQEIYQKQVDEVVKVKLQEFQTQLDVAESEFLEELKTRQQVIAECAARKIKDIIDKHKLEINLLEEKHKEEKRLCELQLAEALQKSSFLESQLNSQRATKSQLAEQLHSVMQNQWQQALQIISGGNMENLTPLQKIHAEKLFELRSPKKSESMPNCYTKISQEPIKLTSHVSDLRKFCDQNECMNTSIDETPLSSRKESKDDLRKYVKMIAEMQKANEEFSKITGSISSPSLTCREVPRKHYLRKECDIRDENHIEWQSVSKETTEFIPISQKISTKGEQQKIKPPWK
ncbi:spindle pole body component 110 [Apis florea]|uniref:spindle pole body component 110 n=1 Tax=Apis florea TaxID=7463 RepID=UPI000252C7FA|nr:spindle pole body component 110 [Apis florea]